MNEHKECGDNYLKKLLPGIETQKEKSEFDSLDSHRDQLKNEELFYRMMER